MRINSEELKGGVLVVAAGMCWGMTGTIQAFAPEKATSLTIGSARVFGAGLLPDMDPSAAGISSIKSNHRSLSQHSGYSISAAFFSAVRANRRRDRNDGGIGSAPVLGITGQALFANASSRWFISLLAVTGCSLLVAAGNSDFSSVSIPGALLALGAALSYALEGAGLRLIGTRDPVETVSLISILSALMALPWLMIGDISWIFSLRGIVCVFFLSVLTTILPFSLFAKGIGKITLGKAYTLSLSEPMTAWMLSTFLLGEKLSILGSAGVLLLFSGIIALACDKNK